MTTFFIIIALLSGFFGALLLFVPKLYSSIAKSLTKVITTFDDATFRFKVPIGILLVVISILTIYIIYLHKQTGLGQ
ncbi:MAG: hypothetical protein FJZ16_07290 [Candidatus Omnitrophica bacterium]|nr:hypothetical protein [Candidatus Omnitrophota bacterium]